MKRLSNYMHLLLALVLLSGVTSCKPALRNNADVLKYINDPKNGLTNPMQRGDVTVTLTWQPWQFLAARMTKPGKKSPKETMPDFSKYCYFTLSFTKNKQELLKQLDYNLYSSMVSVFSFQMQSYITVTADQKEPVKPLECFFEQTYGTSDANRLLLVFNKSDFSNAKKLNITLKEFGLGLGTMDFYLDPENMNVINQLNKEIIKI